MHDLALVMPVYNESECIAQVVIEWRDTLCELGMDFIMIILNDGSKDMTADVLKGFQDDRRLMIVNKANSGHGPTILQGYKLAVEKADWVFQVDSDDEMPAGHFHRLWQNRDQYEALFGSREGRCQEDGRRWISLISRATIGILYGRRVIDVNTPYRLIRSALLGQIITQIPADTFAPNVIISGVLSGSEAKILNVPVPHTNRRTGAVSIVKWRLIKAAIKSFFQTLRCRPKITI